MSLNKEFYFTISRFFSPVVANLERLGIAVAARKERDRTLC